jgi:LuxR family maltose regulon positive regulatory protein
VLPRFVVELREALGPDAGAARSLGTIEPLTRRELGVLHLLAEGLRNADIAGRLFVSETTVKAHLRNINAKLSASSRTGAVAIARQHRLID